MNLKREVMVVQLLVKVLKLCVSKDDGSASSAFGYYANAAASGSTALGFQTVASTKQATAAGYKASASGEGATALGC